MMPESEELLSRQNPDGGWSYRRGGGSWTEASCYALMALCADGLQESDGVRRGIEWLTATQRADGGWSPRGSVDESTWVTAAALLLPAAITARFQRERALDWILRQTGRESGLVYKLRMRLLGVKTDADQQFDGWPWYPGAAAWVAPTALSLLALDKFADRSHVQERIAQGRAFLLARRCQDGGWNHGSTHALGYDSNSYPETTGIALLALHAVDAPPMKQAVLLAEHHLQQCESAEAASWLQLALLARGKMPQPRTLPANGGTGLVTTEIALGILARAAAAGHNLFLTA